MDIFKGSTSNSQFFELIDIATGEPKTGLVYTDVTSASYVRTRSDRTPITPATLASALAGFSAGGFIEVDGTNQPGLYRFDVPNGAFATGATEVVVTIVATGCRPAHRQFNLVNVNNQVAYAPNVAAGSNGGLPLGDASGRVTPADKTGYTLAANGLDSVSIAAPTGVASNFREMIVQLWRRFFKKATNDAGTGLLRTYADDGSTVVTTQTLSSSSGSQTQGSAS